MGSIIMEPDDISTYAGQSGMPVSNVTTICTVLEKINSRGVFNDTNILDYSVPLLLLQLSLSSGAFLLFYGLLRSLGQPLVVAQLLGGIILGPSILGRSHSFANAVFPLKGFVLLDALSGFGFMIYFFLIGVQTDPWIIKKIDRKSFAIGIATVLVPFMLSTAWSSLLTRLVNIETETARSLHAVAEAESALSFPMIAYFLAELKIINSDFGRVALSSSVISGLCNFSVISTIILLNQPVHSANQVLQKIGYSIALAVAIICVIRPLVLWIIRQTPEGTPLKERYVLLLFLAVLVSGFCSQALGLHIHVGPLILGITIPSGPPVGSALVEKLHLVTYSIFLPLFYVKNGLVINIFAPSFKNYLLVQFIALVGATGKFMGAFLTSVYCQIPTRDAVLLGLVMNAQGVLELGMFRMLRRSKVIGYQAFVSMYISMLVVNGAITPIIRYLYDPSRRYMVYGRRTLMHSSPNSELRILVCVHDQENTPTSINLLEALNPTKKSPLAVYIVHLVELVGRAHPLLIPHNLTKKLPSMANASEHIVNAFRYLEQSNYGMVTVYPFTAISPPKTLHNDVCSIALDKRTSLIILPFYKKFHANGTTEFYKKAVKNMNKNVLSKAPCSIAIFVDRGLLKSSRPILASWSSYRVAVLFLGGDDDREALVLGARMAGHLNINLTVIRLIEKGNRNYNDTKESRLDNEVVSEFKISMAGNYRVVYKEVVVIDGAGTIAEIRSMENHYELVVVGRRHNNRSPLVSGLIDWNEDRELGVIGGVLASAEFMGSTTILVVQQHTNDDNECHEHHGESVRSHNVVLEAEEDIMSIQRFVQ